MVESEIDASAAATATARASAAVLTAPLSLEGGLAAELRPANLVQRVLSLFGNVRPGSDLSHFQLPATFNLPKSQLQLYGEVVYCDGGDYLSRCGTGKDSLERLAAVVAWSISTTRPPIFGFAPYNPVLGETHHVSRGSLHVLLEQVSHKPPVSALHATDEGGNVELIWCQHPVPKFHGRAPEQKIQASANVAIQARMQTYLNSCTPFICFTEGTSIEATVYGKRQVKLPKFNETYEVDCPNLLIRLLPGPSVEWSGTVRIACNDSGLEAELSYHRSNSFMGMGGDGRCVKGKVFRSSSPEDTICEIDGYWDRTVSLKDIKSGEVSVLYDANLAIANLVTPEVKDEEGLSSSESAVVWSEVSEAILAKDWEKASEGKRKVEGTARSLEKERNEKGEVWMPKHFSLSQDKNGNWECWPLDKSVPPAPIVVPSSS
ncbi:oxysterol-binding protein-related protein 4C-like isoform X2 [Hordeum vulgare subsp. vulgare]|uniref:oxysterol-binding protein-related protein 4C-like isoform X2 n=1 Tax=Hordeum vulgare subsp. vulgare TaxID=112509 RepID=UPI000B488477|nr:oxysterol-binding protein-related protein 4C-like isoform X2 [Hordeum vulgare subsp. vulgare]